MAGVPRGPSNFDPWQGWEISARNPFLPVGEYTNEAGDVSAGFAMPSIVSEPVNALARLLNTPSGTMPNPQNPEMQQDALTGLLSLYGGNAVSGMARGAGRNALEASGMGLSDSIRAKYLHYKDPTDVSALDAPPMYMFDQEYPSIYGRHDDGTGRGGPWGLHGKRDIVNAVKNDDVPLRSDVEKIWMDLYLSNPEKFASTLPANLRNTLANDARDTFRVLDGGVLSDTGKPSPVGSAIASGAEQGKPIKAYHGTRFASEPLHTYPVTDRMASAGDTKDRLWASSDADVASSYAEPIGTDLYWDEIYPRQTGHTPPPRAGGVFPVEMNFANPLEVDAAGAGFQSVPWEGQIYPADELAYLAQGMGHDGLILKSLQDHMYDQNHAPSTVYAALKRGTVRSPLTGEQLFSDQRPSLMGSAVAASGEFDPYADIPPWLLGLDERVTY